MVEWRSPWLARLMGKDPPRVEPGRPVASDPVSVDPGNAPASAVVDPPMKIMGRAHPLVVAYYDLAGEIFNPDNTMCIKCHASNGYRKPYRDEVNVAHHPEKTNCAGPVPQHMHMFCKLCSYSWWRRTMDDVPSQEQQWLWALDSRRCYRARYGYGEDRHKQPCDDCAKGQKLAYEAEQVFVAFIRRSLPHGISPECTDPDSDLCQVHDPFLRAEAALARAREALDKLGESIGMPAKGID